MLSVSRSPKLTVVGLIGEIELMVPNDKLLSRLYESDPLHSMVRSIVKMSPGWMDSCNTSMESMVMMVFLAATAESTVTGSKTSCW